VFGFSGFGVRKILQPQDMIEEPPRLSAFFLTDLAFATESASKVTIL
jgi:hypothetical protein